MRENYDLYPLTQLGLTARQAGVYIEFMKLRKSSVKVVAKNMQISPPEIYQTLPKLEEIGLVQRILGKPVEYEALPIDQGLSILLELQSKKLNDIRAKADELVKKFRKNEAVRTQEYPPKYVLWLKRTQTRTVDSLIRNSRTSLDVMFSWKAFRGAVHIHFDAYKKALERGTKVRIITNKATNKTEKVEMQEILQNLKALGAIEIRCSSELPAASLAIFEKKIIDIITEPLSTSTEACLRSEDQHVASMMIDYFELKWSGSASV
jgi:sugar-specific transcriptional regulator TrmB